MENLVVHDIPILNNPVLILGFSGWPNAGEVSTGTLGYLIEKLNATRFAEILPEEFYDFTSERPKVVIENGQIKGLEFPSNEFFFWKSPGGHRDLVLFLGKEPHLQWTSYVNCILDLAEQLDVKEICTVGGTFDTVAHSLKPKISVLVNDTSLQERMEAQRLDLSEYKGPISIHTRLLHGASGRNIPAISLWGHAPYYIQVKNLKVCHRMLEKLSRIFKFPLDLEELRRMSEMMDEQIQKALQKKPELLKHIRELENAGRKEPGADQKAPSPRNKDQKAEGDKIIRIEAFLKDYPESEE